MGYLCVCGVCTWVICVCGVSHGLSMYVVCAHGLYVCAVEWSHHASCLVFSVLSPMQQQFPWVISLSFQKHVLHVCSKSPSEESPAGKKTKPNQRRSPQRLCCGRLFLTAPASFRILGKLFLYRPQPGCLYLVLCVLQDPRVHSEPGLFWKQSSSPSPPSLSCPPPSVSVPCCPPTVAPVGAG